jgi:hypothetical protein
MKHSPLCFANSLIVCTLTLALVACISEKWMMSLSWPLAVPQSANSAAAGQDSCVRTGRTCDQGPAGANRHRPNLISEAILGQVLTAGVGQNPAPGRHQGRPADSMPAFTINKVCGSA